MFCSELHCDKVKIHLNRKIINQLAEGTKAKAANAALDRELVWFDTAENQLMPVLTHYRLTSAFNTKRYCGNIEKNKITRTASMYSSYSDQ